MSDGTPSKRPYLIRAMHEWMSDSGHTPHIVVDVGLPGVTVPMEHARDGKIILNISATAAHGLELANDQVSFRARFGGTPFDVRVPVEAVMGIYAKETGQGMIFSQGGQEPDPPEGPSGGSDKDRRRRRREDRGDDAAQADSKGRGSHLKVVK